MTQLTQLPVDCPVRSDPPEDIAAAPRSGRIPSRAAVATTTG
ncbi:hypothetical protein [Micromonospora radicis]|nr:hypothetical protein [Micromonospora radicis]